MESEFDTDGAADPRRPRAFSDWLVPTVVFAFCAVVTYVALQFDTAPPIVIGEAMQPRSFPIFLMGLIAVLNAVLIFQLLSGSRMAVPRQPPQTWISIVLMMVFYVITTYADMFLALMIVIFVMCIVWGERRYWLAALVALLTPITIFFLFDLVLKVRFPRGILTELYYG
ncbi:MAG: tripartite tricarboxylate transporter TctB family protein [Hyphomicrobiaceae bacterium]